MSTDNALVVNDVTRDFNVAKPFRKPRILSALRGIALEIPKGEILGLVGESGCGKSTLAKLLLGIDHPTSGDILVHGRSILSYDRIARAKIIQPVFQDPTSSLNPRITVGNIIAAPLEVRGEGTRSSRAARVRDLMEAVGLPSHFRDLYPSQLSGGQKQRVAIARALSIEPEILICDEPTSALDVSVQSQVLNLIQSLKERLGLTIVLISHNLAVVNHLADRVAVMYLGHIVETARTETIFAAPRHPYTKALIDAVLPPEAGRGLPPPALSGEVPSPINPPAGCAFHPRCPKAFGPCAQAAPASLVHDQHHMVACHLHDPHYAPVPLSPEVPSP